jgi:hypothetical protein
MEKEGQGLSISTLILIVLGVVVLVVIVIGFISGTDFLFEKFGLLPGQSLETVAQSCNIAATANLRVDYCQEFKEVKIDGKKQYVNCEFDDLRGSIGDTLDCGGRDYVREKCSSLLKGDTRLDPNAIIVNGLSCESWGVNRETKLCSDLAVKTKGEVGEWVTGSSQCLRLGGTTKTGEVTSGAEQKNVVGQECCVYVPK